MNSPERWPTRLWLMSRQSGNRAAKCDRVMMGYDDAVRTIVELPDEQLRALADYCAREKVSRAEAVRRAVGAFVDTPDEIKARRRAAIDAAFGIWKDRGVDADTYLAELRSEWER